MRASQTGNAHRQEHEQRRQTDGDEQEDEDRKILGEIDHVQFHLGTGSAPPLGRSFPWRKGGVGGIQCFDTSSGKARI